MLAYASGGLYCGLAVELIVNSEKSLEAAIAELREQFNEKKYVKVKLSHGRQRSLSQNSAAHLFFRNLSDSLNDAGMEQHVFFKDGFFVNWNPETVKENIWKPVQVAICGESSTTKPTREQYVKIYEHVNRLLSAKGLHEPWPTKRED